MDPYSYMRTHTSGTEAAKMIASKRKYREDKSIRASTVPCADEVIRSLEPR